MSRVGKKPIPIPVGVELKIDGEKISVRGPKGSLEFSCSREVKVGVKEKEIQVSLVGNSKKGPALWGTTARIISNMIKGVTEGFQKKLELNGVGYRMNLQGNKLILALGFSHPVEFLLPSGIEAKIEQNVLSISGIDKQQVGQVAANIRALKPVEPYKGKGFRYVGEIVIRKEGKKAVGSA